MDRAAFFDQLIWMKKIETHYFELLAVDFNVLVKLKNAYCCFEVDNAILFFENGDYDPAQSSFEVIYLTSRDSMNQSAPALVFLIDECYYLVIHTGMTRLSMPKVSNSGSESEPPYAAIEWSGGLILRWWLSLCDMTRFEAVQQLSEAVTFINDNLTSEVLSLPALPLPRRALGSKPAPLASEASVSSATATTTAFISPAAMTLTMRNTSPITASTDEAIALRNASAAFEATGVSVGGNKKERESEGVYEDWSSSGSSSNNKVRWLCVCCTGTSEYALSPLCASLHSCSHHSG